MFRLFAPGWRSEPWEGIVELSALLERLDSVKPRGAGQWSAKCPAHSDNNPSLSIREGENGRLLLHDFGGCAPHAIVAALGLELRDLFADAPLPRSQRPPLKMVRVDRVALAFRFDLAALDHRLRAERIFEAGRKLDAATMTNVEIDRALGFVAQAHADLEQAGLFEHVADTLRERDFSERTNRERQTRAA